MDLGIIGSGHIGSTLARDLAALGNQVSIANSRGPDSLAALATGVPAPGPLGGSASLQLRRVAEWEARQVGSSFARPSHLT